MSGAFEEFPYQPEPTEEQEKITQERLQKMTDFIDKYGSKGPAKLPEPMTEDEIRNLRIRVKEQFKKMNEIVLRKEKCE